MELRLMETPEKKIHWKQQYTNSIYRIWEEEKKSKYKMPYGAVIGQLSKVIETVPTEENNYYGWGVLDEETGVIKFEIPQIEDFESQYRAFLNNGYAKSCNYALSLFFKCYGTYEAVKEPVPLKVKPVVKATKVFIQCSDCNTAHWSDQKCNHKPLF